MEEQVRSPRPYALKTSDCAGMSGLDKLPYYLEPLLRAFGRRCWYFCQLFPLFPNAIIAQRTWPYFKGIQGSRSPLYRILDDA
jgi:hypothetical protein